MQKRGQNWSMELLISVSLFIVVFIGAIGLLTMQSQSNTQQVVRESDILVNQLYGNEDEITVIAKDGKVTPKRLEELSQMSENELKDHVGIDADFCIILRNPQTGKVIPVYNGTEYVVGVGSSKISVAGKTCGKSIS